MAELPQTSHIRLDLRGAVLHLWLDRPELRNALSPQMVREILATFAAIADDRSVRVVVLRGAGGTFCAGADIKSMAATREAPSPGAADELKESNRRFGAMLETVNAAPQAVIAAVEGYAMGGGFGLACVADITIATADAQFAMTEVRIGVVPAAISPFVVKRIGLTAARRFGVSGARLNGSEACAIGVAHLHGRGRRRARCGRARRLQSGAQMRPRRGRRYQTADAARCRFDSHAGAARRRGRVFCGGGTQRGGPRGHQIVRREAQAVLGRAGGVTDEPRPGPRMLAQRRQIMIAFSKILIANRGEIACRIIRTAKALGYRTVGVFSDADAGALHVRQADEAVRIGPPPAQDSYLNIDALLAAAKLAGADAVHPGYGFLSENAAFAQACAQAGLIFIGPPAAAIDAMGNKARAKALMKAADIPCVPGYQGPDQSNDKMMAEGRRIGFPLMVKAAAGGGGRGMRLVDSADDLANALARSRSEAASAFGSDELILEHAIPDARHIEIQVFADQHGNIIHLGERDCSIQRRHQKVIEETPSPAVSTELRTRMGEAAVAAARAIGYVSAGTVEFLLDQSGKFYFLEMNTRLQVEHPVTEAITGVDLVEWQLRVAAGERLPLEQHEVQFSGHAIEARLYAEDPHRGFLPQSGTLIDWRPAAAAGVRIDHGLVPGQSVSLFYDAMLAKVIAHGATREEARRRLIAAIEDTVALGLTTNRAFLIAMLRHPAFAAGEATTAFIQRHFPAGSDAMRRPTPDARMLALAAVLLFTVRAGETANSRSAAPHWSSTGAAAWPLRLTLGDVHHPAGIMAAGPDRYSVVLGNETVDISIMDCSDGSVRFTALGLQQTARFAMHEGVLHLDLNGITVTVRETILETDGAARRDGSSRLLAPMNGAIVDVLAKPGDRVARGQRIVVLEAMKMQHEISAERDGTIDKILVKPGDQVATRQLLVVLKPETVATPQQTEQSP